MVRNKRVPDRWKEYTPCLWTPIENHRIISFKTPLSKKFEAHVEGDEGLIKCERFTPSDLISELEKRGFYLGKVLDFTFTKRYYDPKEFTDRGIIYKKMMCPGHEIPKEQDVKRFEYEVQSFIDNDKTGALVGVHCTHGLNRTGYMVCRYLIDCKGYQPEDAIKAFNDSRGHSIERENYLEDLKSRSPGYDVDFTEISKTLHLDDEKAGNTQDRDSQRERKFIPQGERGDEHAASQYSELGSNRKRNFPGVPDGPDDYSHDFKIHRRHAPPREPYQRPEYSDRYMYQRSHPHETYAPQNQPEYFDRYATYPKSNLRQWRPGDPRERDYRYNDRNYYDYNSRRDFNRRPDPYHSSYHGNNSELNRHQNDYWYSEDYSRPRNRNFRPWNPQYRYK